MQCPICRKGGIVIRHQYDFENHRKSRWFYDAQCSLCNAYFAVHKLSPKEAIEETIKNIHDLVKD